jgi:hypothetical protein
MSPQKMRIDVMRTEMDYLVLENYILARRNSHRLKIDDWRSRIELYN